VGRIRVPGTIKAGSEWCVAAASQKKLPFQDARAHPSKERKKGGG